MGKVCLGIDFGTRFAWSVGRDMKIIAFNAVDLAKRAEQLRGDRGKVHIATAMFQELRTVIKEHEVEVVCHENSEQSFRGAAMANGLLDRATASHTRYGAILDLLVDSMKLEEIDAIMPTSLKKFACNNGHATKEQMIAAARRFYAIDVTDDNAADACHVAMYAMNELRVAAIVKAGLR